MKRIVYFLPAICFICMQCNLSHKKNACLVPNLKDTTLYFQSGFEYTFDTMPAMPELIYIDTGAQVNVLYKGFDSCYYVKNIKIGLRDKKWEFVEITSTNIVRIEMVCTDSGTRFFQTRKLISNEMMTTLDTTRKEIPVKISDGFFQLEGVVYLDTPLITAESEAELIRILHDEVHIDTLYKHVR